MTRRGWLLLVTLGAIWGVPYLLIRVADTETAPFFLVFVRTALGALCLLPIAWRRLHPRELIVHWKALLAYTLSEILLPWPLIFRAEEHISSSFTALVIATAPLFGLLVLRIIGEERHIGARRLFGIVLGLFGVGLLVGSRLVANDLLAVGEVVVAAIGYAVGPIVVNRHLTSLPSLSVVTTSLVISALVSAPLGLMALPHHLTLRVGASIAGLTFVCTALGFCLFFALIAEVGPARATVVNYVSPAVAVAVGVAALGESITLPMGAGFVAIIAGCIFSTARNRGPGRSDGSTGPSGLQPIAESS